jgi:hypothetical protein
MPARFGDCGLGDCRRVRFRRRFGRPRQIDGHERLWLIGEELSGRGDFYLNGQFIGKHGDEPRPSGSGAFEFPITDLVAERNELTVDIAADGPGAGLWGDVALEIRCAAYLRDVLMSPAENGRLRISGEVAGERNEPLEIYVLADDKTVAYRTCGFGAFEMITDESVGSDSEIRVELVNGATVWYVFLQGR